MPAVLRSNSHNVCSTTKGLNKFGVLELIMCFFLGFVFVAAAMSKSFRPEDFQSVIRSLVQSSANWSLGEVRTLSFYLSLFVIMWECLIGLLLFSGMIRKIIFPLVTLTLLLFCVVLVRLLFIPDAPGCGCLGISIAVSDAHSEIWLGLVRNVAMIWIAIWLTARVWPRHGGPSVALDLTDGPRRTPENERGFTLIEVLVTIAVIALLIGILLPALVKAKRAGKWTESLASHRQLLSMIDLYSDGYGGAYPYLATRGDPDAGLSNITNNGGYPVFYFYQSKVWPTILQQDGFDIAAIATTPEKLAKARIKYDDNPDVVPTSFLMTHAVAAAPAYWVPSDNPPDDLRLYRGMRVIDVRFPAAKGLLVDLNKPLFPDPPDIASEESPDFHNQRWSVGFADGSASVRPRKPVWSEFSRPYGALPWSIMITPNGVYGRDY